MAYRLIAFDMDGTLLDTHKRIPSQTLDAIREAQAAGKVVALSTGRNPAEIDILREELSGVRYRICCSGGMVWDAQTDEMIFSQPLAEEDIRRILAITADFDVMIHMLSRQSVAQRSHVERMPDFHMAVYQPMYRRIATQVEDLRGEWLRAPWPVYKLNLYFRSLEERAQAEKRLHGMPIEMVYSERTSLECSPHGIGKGSGLLALCRHLQIPVEQTIAVGDADNDLEILRTAGLAVAMGNANDRVKAAADVIVSDNDHGGCAEAIRNWLI